MGNPIIYSFEVRDFTDPSDIGSFLYHIFWLDVIANTNFITLYPNRSITANKYIVVSENGYTMTGPNAVGTSIERDNNLYTTITINDTYTIQEQYYNYIVVYSKAHVHGHEFEYVYDIETERGMFRETTMYGDISTNITYDSYRSTVIRYIHIDETN